MKTTNFKPLSHRNGASGRIFLLCAALMPMLAQAADPKEPVAYEFSDTPQTVEQLNRAREELTPFSRSDQKVVIGTGWKAVPDKEEGYKNLKNDLSKSFGPGNVEMYGLPQAGRAGFAENAVAIVNNLAAAMSDGKKVNYVPHSEQAADFGMLLILAEYQKTPILVDAKDRPVMDNYVKQIETQLTNQGKQPSQFWHDLDHAVLPGLKNVILYDPAIAPPGLAKILPASSAGDRDVYGQTPLVPMVNKYGSLFKDALHPGTGLVVLGGGDIPVNAPHIQKWANDLGIAYARSPGRGAISIEPSNRGNLPGGNQNAETGAKEWRDSRARITGRHSLADIAQNQVLEHLIGTGTREYWCGQNEPGGHTAANIMAETAVKSLPQRADPYRVLVVADTLEDVQAMKKGLHGIEPKVITNFEWLTSRRQLAQSFDVVIGVRNEIRLPEMPIHIAPFDSKTKPGDNNTDFPDPPTRMPVPVAPPMDRLKTLEPLPPMIPRPPMIPHIGGVMLHGVAKVNGGSGAQVDLTSGFFSLVVEGANARIAPEIYRKFITALWAVYYSRQDPGISIDPIEWGGKKHLVRYIGRVINTDLGRVMREADYVMKKWAVGTERPDLPGFENPDDLSAKSRCVYYGASSRFWFVPEDMTFRRAGDALLFASGRMTVKTEFNQETDGGLRADPSNEKFAGFFTSRYDDIAKKYPVYQELFDYAKMVGLAKYLKDSGAPLFWFLMANKDLVLTEDSPGTVDALAKGSDYFKNLQIEGGVDLATQGRYVYDANAVAAVNQALSNARSRGDASTTGSSQVEAPVHRSDPLPVSLDTSIYTVAPQHSLTCGKDRNGTRYQTDLALKAEGFQLTQASLAALCYDLFRKEMADELRPALQGLSDKQLESKFELLYIGAREKAEKKVENLAENLGSLTNQEYKTELDLTNASEKAIGKEQTDRFKPLIVKHAHYLANLELVRYFQPRQQTVGEFGNGWHLLIPYRIKPADSKTIEFRNLIIPKSMVVENLITGGSDTLTFSDNRYSVAGYVPDTIQSSQFTGLFLTIGGTYELRDKLGNEFRFDGAGFLTDMIFSEDHRIQVAYLDEFTAAFDHAPYRVQPAGDERVEFLNARIPKRMAIKDLAHETSETLVFSDKGRMAGYVPEKPEQSRFQILALRSDASFQLLDKENNEITFSPAGEFERFAPSSSRRMVQSISDGRHTVDFTYTINPSGKVMVARARLSKLGTDPNYVVCYSYDGAGRLCDAKGTSVPPPDPGKPAADKVAMAK